QPSQDFMRF
uniref:FMRFamide-1 n=1 Tax=Sarcophaga bullata TaxID=7385 RepID=FAR1_SARBU|nr:RecName: Full=FMRFamide-1; AltName: Full=Neb-FMRFamide-1; AltName: Full=SabFMRFamide-1 [Sarcophaga bullata]